MLATCISFTIECMMVVKLMSGLHIPLSVPVPWFWGPGRYKFFLRIDIKILT
jgi:hypothetical protein